MEANGAAQDPGCSRRSPLRKDLWCTEPRAGNRRLLVQNHGHQRPRVETPRGGKGVRKVWLRGFGTLFSQQELGTFPSCQGGRAKVGCAREGRGGLAAEPASLVNLMEVRAVSTLIVIHCVLRLGSAIKAEVTCFCPWPTSCHVAFPGQVKSS